MATLEKKKRVLLQNTVMLYVLRFSTMFLGFLTLPYISRVVGQSGSGYIANANFIAYYFFLLVDFGFILSATETVSKNRSDQAVLNRTLSAVYAVKGTLILLSMGALGLLFAFDVFGVRENALLVCLYFAAMVMDACLPDFMYRGLEVMSPITYRTVAVKATSTLLLFLFLRRPEDIWVIPSLTFVGNTLACLWSLYDLRKRFQLQLVKIERQDYLDHFRVSGSFFLSRVASTLYTALNSQIVKSEISLAMSGQYYQADRLIGTGKAALAPIADGVYPYMVKHRDFKLIRKILLLLMPIIVLFCALIAVFATPFALFVFGREFTETGKILLAMLPGAVLVLPDYLLGFPSLAALNLTKYANYSIYASAIFHVTGLGLLYLFGQITAVTLAALGSASIAVECLYRLIIVMKGLKQQKRSLEEEEKLSCSEQ